MFEFWSDLFAYRFLGYAVLACIACGVACGVIGTYVVCRRLVFLSGGITHASFGGIGIAYYAGWDPLLGALGFALLSALGIERFSASRGVREDSAIGLLWSLGMSIGVIFLYMTPGYAPNLMSFLFGNILSVSASNLIWMGVVDLIILLFFARYYRHIIALSFDRSHAQTQRRPVRMLSYLLAMLVAATIVISIRVVGIVMLISLLTIPTMIAGTFIRSSFSRIALWSTFIATAGMLLGLWVSYQTNIPCSAATIFILTSSLIVVKALPLQRAASRRRFQA